jgi:hypothetical protein
MKRGSHNGSIGDAIRDAAVEPRYHLVVKNPGETNTVMVGLKDRDGTLLTNVNFLVIKPAELVKIQIKDDVDFKEPSFWKNVVINQSLTLIVITIFVFLFGWKNVKNTIKRFWK